MKVIGVVGRIGAGKDQVADCLRDEHGIATLSAGDVVRRLAAEEGLTANREDLHAIAERYRRQEGEGFAMRCLIDEIEQPPSWKVVVIDGVRTPADVQVLKQHFGDDFVLVHVRVSDPRVRFERLRERGEPRDPETYDEFKHQDQREEQRFNLSRTTQMADVTLDNDGSVEELHEQIERKIVQRELSDIIDEISNDEH